MPNNDNIILLKIKAERKRFIIVWMGGKVEWLGVKIIGYCGYINICVQEYLALIFYTQHSLW